jgi:High potential iron-sulfur protein
MLQQKSDDKVQCSDISRREFVRGTLHCAAIGGVLAVLDACGNKQAGESIADACVDPENGLKDSLHYQEASPSPDTVCAACAFFRADAGTSHCGNCDLLHGSVNRGGHCDSWSKRA